jgi:hypothetical protein
MSQEQGNECEKSRLVVRVAVPQVRWPARPCSTAPKNNAGPCPLAGWLALDVSTYSFGRRDVGHMYQHSLGSVHVEHLGRNNHMLVPVAVAIPVAVAVIAVIAVVAVTVVAVAIVAIAVRAVTVTISVSVHSRGNGTYGSGHA